MKKVVILFLAFILATTVVLLCSCGDKDGTYYPNDKEMKTALEKSGYTVTVTSTLGGNGGIYLAAMKGKDYIHFYWLNDSSDCDYFYGVLEEYHNYDSLVLIKDDEKFGNIVYCATEQTIKDAKIKVVKVVVKA